MNKVTKRFLPLLFSLLLLLSLASCQPEDETANPSSFTSSALSIVNELPAFEIIDNLTTGMATAIAPGAKDVAVGVGVTTPLSVTFTPPDATDQVLTWKSANEQVATVSETGVLTGVAAGTCAVTAVYKSNPELRADFNVTVGFSALSATSKTNFLLVVYIGSQSVGVYGKASDGKFSLQQKFMTCSTGTGLGTITGEYTITAKYRWRQLVGGSYGQYGSSLGKNNYLFHSVPYSLQTPNAMSMSEYKKLGQKASLGCVRLCVADAKWIYDTIPLETTVIVTEESGTAGPPATALRTESRFIGWDPTDPSTDNPYLNPNVSEPSPTISLNKNYLDLFVGKGEKLTATVTNGGSNKVVWSSSDKNVATVNQSGNVTAVRAGTATIAAKCGGVEAFCTVRVTAPISVSLNKTRLTLTVGKSEKLIATVKNADNNPINWSSSNTSVATVDQNGNVTAKGTGTVTITVECGGIKAICSVTVIAVPPSSSGSSSTPSSSSSSAP